MKLLSESIEQRLFSRSFVRIAAVCAVLGFVMSAVSLLPAFQNGIIRFAEDTLVHRLIDHEKWLGRLFSMSFTLISITALAVAFLVSIEDARMKKAQIVFPAVLLFFILFYVSFITYRYSHYWLDSDYASYLIFAKTLAEENALFSSKWYYSTGFTFIGQPFALLLFKICNNWPLIRAVNTFIWHSILILSFLFMMRQTKAAFKYSLLMSCFLIVPLSEGYWHYVVSSTYYNTIFIYIFLMTGCFFALLQKKEGRAFGIPYAALLYALAFLTGTESIRMLFNFMLPLALAVFLAAYFDVVKEKTAAYRTIFTAFVFSLLGYLTNTIVLKKFFMFSGHEEASFSSIGSDFFERFSRIFFDTLAVFWGYKPASVLSIGGFLSAVSLLFFAVSTAGFVIMLKNICTTRKKQLFLELCRSHSVECFLSLFFITALLFNGVFFMFVNDRYAEPRYFYPILIFLFAAIPVFLTLYTPGINRFVHSFLCVVLCGFLFGHGALMFGKQLSPDENQNISRNGYLAYLEANSLVYGFATFWNAGVTTELSNGRIEMAGLFPHFEITRERAWGDIMFTYRYKWLSPAKFDNPYYHKGQAFLLLEKKEWEYRKNEAVLADKNPAYMDDFYVVLVYPEAAVIHREIMRENF